MSISGGPSGSVKAPSLRRASFSAPAPRRPTSVPPALSTSDTLNCAAASLEIDSRARLASDVTATSVPSKRSFAISGTCRSMYMSPSAAA